MRIFVDTSVWFSAINTNDISHIKAKKILSGDAELVTSTLVLTESWRLLHQKIHWQAAEKFFGVLRRGAATLEIISMADLESAWLIGQRYSDEDFSLTDRTSFAMMERLQIFDVATFDSDFAVYRFGKTKRGAFQLHG